MARFDSGSGGHYRTYNFGLTNFRIVLRKGTLIFYFTRGEATQREATSRWFPWRPAFFASEKTPDRRKQSALTRWRRAGRCVPHYSLYGGCPYYRTYTP